MLYCVRYRNATPGSPLYDKGMFHSEDFVGDFQVRAPLPLLLLRPQDHVHVLRAHVHVLRVLLLQP